MASLIQDFLIKSKEMPLRDLIKTVSKPNKFSALIKFADIHKVNPVTDSGLNQFFHEINERGGFGKSE